MNESTSSHSSSPRLSVVVATTDPWPAVRGCLDRLCPQIRKLNAELILADSTGEGLPSPVPQEYQVVRWLHVPGASVFALRARATETATGGIVAWTEDHCLPAMDWCERMLAAHAERGDADAIGGGVVNGSTRKLMDWANFFLTFGPLLPPLELNKIERVPPAANVSFKRRSLPTGPVEPGWIELVLKARLWREGRIRFDERIVVEHVQSNGLWGTPAAHFHNGRSTAGLVVHEMPPTERRRRIRRCLILPKEILRTSLRTLRPKTAVRRTLLASLPFMTLLATCHAAGELTGLLLGGAGNSPNQLQ